MAKHGSTNRAMHAGLHSVFTAVSVKRRFKGYHNLLDELEECACVQVWYVHCKKKTKKQT